MRESRLIAEVSDMYVRGAFGGVRQQQFGSLVMGMDMDMDVNMAGRYVDDDTELVCREGWG